MAGESNEPQPGATRELPVSHPDSSCKAGMDYVKYIHSQVTYVSETEQLNNQRIANQGEPYSNI